MTTRLAELEERIVQACKDMQAKGVRVERGAAINYDHEGTITRCCALVAASPPASYEAWLAEEGSSFGEAGRRLGLTAGEIDNFIAGFDCAHGGRFTVSFVALGARVATRVLGGGS